MIWALVVLGEARTGGKSTGPVESSFLGEWGRRVGPCFSEEINDGAGWAAGAP